MTDSLREKTLTEAQLRGGWETRIGNLIDEVPSMMDRQVAKQFLKGHARAQEVLRAEKQARLLTRTQAESLAEYERLCHLWYSQPKEVDAVEPTHLEALLRVRRAMASLERPRHT